MKKINGILRTGLWLFLTVWGASVGNAWGQNVAIKTNALSLATTTISLGAEMRLKPKWTLNLEACYNPWTFSGNKKIKHFIVQPEIRWWQSESFNRGFFGLHVMAGKFNAGGIDFPLNIWDRMEENRFEGNLVGVGVSYGWSWFLGRHWSVESTFGFGYMRLHYDRYECMKCGYHFGTENKNYFGPTKIGVSLVYLF